MHSRRWLFSIALLRSLLVGIAILTFLIDALGVPLPLPPSSKPGPPFPCQNRPCGCASAEECWRHCCCFTPEQRIAWAREHNVAVPDYAQKASEGGWSDRPRRVQEADPPPAATCCCCCKEEHAPSAAPASKGSSPLKETARRWQSGMASRACKGENGLWHTGLAALSPPPRLNWAYEWNTCGDVISPRFSCERRLCPPPLPPPRFSSGIS